MQNTIKVTIAELATILANTTIVKGMGNFVNIVQQTTPKTTKKDRDTKEPFTGVITKVSAVSVILNTEYEKVVTNQLEREGKKDEDYKRGRNTMPIEKGENNNFYGTFHGKPVIEYKPNAANKPLVRYFLDGIETAKADLPNVLPTQSKATNQGTDVEVKWRKLYVSNIVHIALNGQQYEVTK